MNIESDKSYQFRKYYHSELIRLSMNIKRRVNPNKIAKYDIV